MNNPIASIEEIAAVLSLKRNGRGYSGNCPSCGYKTGFTLIERHGQVLLFCHAGGCSYQEIRQALIHEGLLLAPKFQFKLGHSANRANWAKKSVASPSSYDPAVAARKLWQQSQRAERTLVEAYLKSRGYIGPIPSSIRFLPEGWHSETETHYPVMLAGVTRYPASEVVAVHRTFLRLDGHGRVDKKFLGPTAGGAIRMADAGNTLLVTEGIENALTVYMATGLPAWAALSTGGMKNLILPTLPLATEVVICADHDGPGLIAAQAAAKRFVTEGRRVRIAKPDQPGSDFNDVGRA